MNDAEITQQAAFAAQRESLCAALQTAAAKLRMGDDADGIDAMLAAMSELKKLVEIDQKALQPRIDLYQVLTAVKTLLLFIKNKDITGIADLLDDVFYPIAKTVLEGSERI